MPDSTRASEPHPAEQATGHYEPAAPSTLGHSAESASTDPAAPSAARPDAPPPGYEFLRVLGRGGMGIVYRAHQLALKRDVAIKMMLARRGATAEQIARFRSEAEAVARFQHPNIVQIFEVGDADGQPYCVLEFVGGGTLAERIKRQPPTPVEAAALAECIARAAHYAHQRQILHRDLKPGNVLLTADGAPKIADFGLAKHLDDDAGQTREGDVVGTPRYMAPEQARGDPAGLGPHTDVYAIGVMLYEMLTGRVPFNGSSTIELLHRVQHAEPPPPRSVAPGIPANLETICLKCLRKDPNDRYRSAMLLAQDLERFQSGEPILARPEGAARRALRRVQRHRTAALGFAAAAALLLALYTIGGSRRTQQVADIEQRVQDSLETIDWTPETARELDRRLDELAALEPDRAATLRGRAHLRYRQAIVADLAHPRISDADWTAIEAQTRDLAAREPAFAADLESRVRERRSESIRVLDLEPPFAGHEAAFANPDWLRIDGPALKRVFPEPRPVMTKASAAGSVRVEAHFEDWRRATRLGVVLGPSASPYRFLVGEAEPNGGLVAMTLEQAAARGAAFLIIRRDNVELLRRPVHLAGDVLILRATRNGDHLAIHVNDQPPAECHDPFPLPDGGPIGFDFPVDGRLRRALAVRGAAPVAANPLERGNQLFLQADYQSAIGFFRQFRAASTDPTARAEARYKIAASLARLNRLPEAAAFLETNDDTPPGRWHALGLYQLWRIRSEQGDLARGSELFRIMKAQYPPDELLNLVPSPELMSVWLKYDFPPTDLLFTPNVVDRALTLVEIGDLLRRSGALSLSNWAQSVRLAERAWQYEGKLDKALDLLGRCLKELEFAPPSDDRLVALGHLLEDYAWLLGLTGGHDFANTELIRFEPKADSIPVLRLRIVITLARARLLAQRRDWDAAERELDSFLAILRLPAFQDHVRAGRMGGYYHHATERMLRGLVREERGDAAGALECFRSGTRRAYLESVPPNERAWRIDTDSNTIRDNLYMMSRTGRLTDAEAIEERDSIVKLFAGSPAVGSMANLLPLPPDALRTMWALPSGRAAIRAIHFRTVNHSEATWLPMRQLAIAVFHVDAVTTLTPAHEAILEMLAQRLLEMLKARKLGRSTMAMLANMWVAGPGSLGLFGWQGVKPQIPKDTLPAIAWLLGHRSQKLKRPDDARFYFQAAIDAGDPKISPLAAAELTKLRPTK